MSEKSAIQTNAFEKLSQKKLSSDESEEMKHNFFGFMNLLIEIDEQIKQGKEFKND